MAVMEAKLTERYAAYCGDCVQVMRDMPAGSVHLAVYSPPFAGLYQYSSDERDMSNSIDRDEFFEHYGYCIAETARLLLPGRLAFVHCMDIPLSNAGCDAVFDLPGRIIAEHEARGFVYAGRRVIWKEPLAVRNRTMMKSLHHATLCDDSTRTSIANADFLLTFRKRGENRIPVAHPTGLLSYAGEDDPTKGLEPYRGMTGDQKKNLFSQHIWRRYASSVWMDVRIDRVLPHRQAREDDDEAHVHPLQLDVIERAVVMGSNPGEVVLTPFMGVGSEVYGAVVNGRKGVGIELKPAYYRQALLNLADAAAGRQAGELNTRSMLDLIDEADADPAQPPKAKRRKAKSA
jgi:DNA modification methylase